MPRLVGPALTPDAFHGPQPRLEAPGLRLRAWTEDDVTSLVRAYADPAIQRWHCRTLDTAEALDQVQHWRNSWEAGTGVAFAVTGTDDDHPNDGGTPLARVGLREVDLDAGVAEVAYWVLPDQRGRGLAGRAVEALSRWAFSDIGFQRLRLLHSVHNPASCRVAVRSGFAAEGTERGSVRHADGWHDMHLHARLRTD